MELQGALRRHIGVRNLTLVVVLGMLLAVASPVGAQSAPEVTAEVGLDGYIDPYQPIPISVELTSPVLWVGSLEASLGSQRTSTDIEVPAGGNKVYDLVLPAPGSDVNRQIRLRFTPEGSETVADTVTVQVRFPSDVELVAVIGGPDLADILDQARTIGVGTDIDVAEIDGITPALGIASYLVAGRGALDGLGDDQLSELEGWILDGGRLIANTADLGRVGAADGPAVTFGGASIAPYGDGELIDVDPASLSVDQWSSVVRSTPGLFISQNFGNPNGFDLFQAATGDSTAGAPQIPWLLAGLVAYALLVGPVNFLVLRSIGRRELVWATIPALSALAVFAFWLFGPRTAVAQVTHASAVVLDGEVGAARSGLIMVAGQEGEHTLGVPDGWSASPAGDLRQFFGPVALGGTDLVSSTDTEFTFDTDSLEAVPLTSSHPVSFTGLSVTAAIEGRQINLTIDNQSGASFWYWGVGAGLSATGASGELESGMTETLSVRPGIQQDPWQAPMATAYWNRGGGFFDDGNEVWQIIEPLGREVGRNDRRVFEGNPYFFGYTDDLTYDVAVDGRAVQSRGPALIVVPVDFDEAEAYSLGQVSAQLLASSGQDFIEEGFSPFIVGADEVFVRFSPPRAVSEASVRASNPFGGPANQSDVSVFDWQSGVFVNLIDVAGSRVGRFPLDAYRHPTGEILVKLEPNDFGEVFPSSITLEWTP